MTGRLQQIEYIRYQISAKTRRHGRKSDLQRRLFLKVARELAAQKRAEKRGC